MDTAYWGQFKNIPDFHITVSFLSRNVCAPQSWVDPQETVQQLINFMASRFYSVCLNAPPTQNWNCSSTKLSFRNNTTFLD